MNRPTTIAVIGITVGFGRLGTALFATVLTLTILSALTSLEKRITPPDHHSE